MNGALIGAVCAAGLLGGCVKEARIAVPSDLAAGETLALEGLGGGGDRGSLRIGETTGRFERGSGRMRLFGTVTTEGGAWFELAGPLIDGRLEGECRFDEEEQRLGDGVSLTTRPIVYECRFARDGATVEGGLRIAASHESGGSMFREERAGTMVIGGQRLAVRSIHAMAGGGMKTLTPLGYRFEDAGRSLGAVDLNGGAKTIHAAGDSRRQREAVIAASVALALFRDPAGE